MTRSRSKTPSAQIKNFAIEAARLCADRKCEDVLLFDVRAESPVCDYVIVATGTSERQMRSVAHELGELGKTLEHKAWRSSADEGGTWIVIDCVDVVVHLFEPEQRAYYDLEALWADSPRVPWRRTTKAKAAATDA